MARFNSWEKLGNRVSVLGSPEPKPKKLTGTRLGAAMGLNHWKTPFGAWCEICRVAELPFEGNKFTEAGQHIEPKAIEFAKGFVSPNIKTPYDVYGTKADHLYDYYPNEKIFGGMWDGLVCNRKGDTIGIVEIKTTSRPQDWVDGVPDSYALQALLYAYLSGVPTAWVVVCFLEPEHYDNPEVFECSEENTRIYELSVSDYSIGGNTIFSWYEEAGFWWENHVEANISPSFDPKKDKEYLDIMRSSMVELPDTLSELAKEVASLEDKVLTIRKKYELDELEAQLKELKEKSLKPALIAACEDGKSLVETDGWSCSMTMRKALDKEHVRATLDICGYNIDDFYEETPSWTLRRKRIKGAK